MNVACCFHPVLPASSSSAREPGLLCQIERLPQMHYFRPPPTFFCIFAFPFVPKCFALLCNCENSEAHWSQFRNLALNIYHYLSYRPPPGVLVRVVRFTVELLKGVHLHCGAIVTQLFWRDFRRRDHRGAVNSFGRYGFPAPLQLETFQEPLCPPSLLIGTEVWTNKRIGCAFFCHTNVLCIRAGSGWGGLPWG